ncbi:hypothetical protein [Paenibacillus sp. FSL H8-0537]|uniref:hypothetical protein n=1 Tax=Paenibacillus sp. FSL H8-0537 TaxID=2921399 RepID=UPI003101A490
MNEKRLPIIKPVVHGYLCNAYPLSVVLQDNKSDDWFYSNYIQLVCAGNFPQGKFFSFYNSHLPWYEFFTGCPLINYQKIHYSYTEKYNDGTIGFILDAIDKNEYVYLHVDEYYVSHKKAYQFETLPHEMMISGYDKDSEKLYVSGYDKDMNYGEYEVDFSEFQTAFTMLDKTINNRGYIYLLQHNKEYKYSFDIKLVIQSLKELRNSDNTSLHYRSITPPASWIFGICIYDELVKYLEADIDGSNGKIDARLFHTLWEHKSVMAKRIKYMEEHNYLEDGSAFIEKFSYLESLILNMRNLVLKYNVRENPSLIKSIIEKICEMKEVEAATLDDLIIVLENRWKAAPENLIPDNYL